MPKRIDVNNQQSPMTTATEVMKFRNEGKSLTPEFCISILEKSDNGSVSFKLLEVIKSHIEHHPQTLHEYAPILSELWYRSIKSKKNTNFLARMIEENIEKTNIDTSTTQLLYLLSKSENLSSEKTKELQEYLHQILPLTQEQKKALDEEIVVNKVKQEAYKDIAGEIVPQAHVSPECLYRVQQELSKQNKLEYNQAYGNEWNYCALGIKDTGELDDEKYKQITNISPSIRKKYPQSILVEIHNITSQSGFADEKRAKILADVKLLEETKDFPYLQNPKLCYENLVYSSIYLAGGAVNRSQMIRDGIEKEFSSIFSRMLQVYNRDKQKLNERENTLLALLLESQCQRKMQDLDFNKTYKDYSYFLSRDDLIVLTYPYALKKGILADGLMDKMHVNVFQLDKRPLDYLPKIKTSQEMYRFLKGFRVHSDEEEIIDLYPELAMEDISKHRYYLNKSVEEGTQNFLQSVKVNMSIINKSCEEGKGISDTERNLLVATIGAMMDKYTELKDHHEDTCADDIYEQILVFCADKEHQVSEKSQCANSHYLSIVYANRHVDIVDLSFKTPEKCAAILEKFRAERAKRLQNAENILHQAQDKEKSSNLLQRMKSKFFGR